MLASRLYVEDWDVDARLAEFSGITRAELYQVVREVVGARADASPDDPLAAAGLFAYILGTRHKRALFRSKGWFSDRRENIEATIHPDGHLKVAYQSVDVACDPFHTPQAISGKGNGAERVIAQGSLFSDEEIAALAVPSATQPPAGMWFFCVSVNGDDVRAELSKASGVAGGNFRSFEERIFILRKGEWEKIRVIGGDDSSDAIELEPTVRRK
jgi:hypothetical protein